MDDADGRAGDRLIQVFDGTRHVAVWPVGASGPGQIRQANVSINCPTAHADAFSRSGAWKAVVARHCPALLPMIENLPCGFLPLVYRYRDVAMQRLVAGRVVFIGDAAHSMSPLLGQGARMALLDAATLAQCLREGVDTDAALDAFDRRCRAQVETFQTISRWLTPVFQSQSRIASALRLSVQLSQRLPFFASRARELLIGEGPMNF
jgi:2-polyprenyl-6-methoxyphenol hydroxylase-like FAD-dependent oxidoreductase